MRKSLLFALAVILGFSGIIMGQDVDYDPNNPKASDSAGIFGFKNGSCPPVRTLNGPLQLVINHNHKEPVISLILDPSQRFPVFFNSGTINTDTLVIEAYLPPVIPQRLPKQPEFRPPKGCFTLFVTYMTEADTAEYRVNFIKEFLLLEVETIREAKYVVLQKLRQKPDNIVLLQFPDYDQADIVKKQFKKIAKCVRLEPGNYEGLPFTIEKGKQGMNFNPYLGVILALKLPNDPVKRQQIEEELSHYRILGG